MDHARHPQSPGIRFSEDEILTEALGKSARHPVTSLLLLARPGHWIKNVFVLAGVFFADQWRRPETLYLAAAACAAFCLAASAVYAGNDALDAEEDRANPRKRTRPVAAGEIQPLAALAFSAGLAAAALALSLWASPHLAWTVVAYLAVNIAYSRGAKRLVLVDVFCIAAGFILRLLGGTWGIGVEPSQWFLLCTMALSLFLGFSKRYAELMEPERPLEAKRAVLRNYSPEFLRILLGVTMSATLITYGLYTTNPRTIALHGTGHLIYSLPIAMFGMFRYLYLVMHKGFGENTGADMIKDRAMLATCLLYVAAVAVLLVY